MERRERMTRHNLAGYEGHVRNYICSSPQVSSEAERRARVTPFSEGIAAVKLAQLSASKVADVRDRLREAGVSVATTRKILGTLQVMLEYAVSRDLMAVNPARGIRVIGRRDGGARKIEPLSKVTLRRLIEVADPDFRVKLVLASASGLRAGELHALRWRHVDFRKGEPAVEGRVDAYGDEDTTKTAAGLRKVPLGNDVLAALKAWRLRSLHSKPDDLVFPNRDGQYSSCHRKQQRRPPHPPGGPSLFVRQGSRSVRVAVSGFPIFASSPWVLPCSPVSHLEHLRPAFARLRCSRLLFSRANRRRR